MIEYAHGAYGYLLGRETGYDAHAHAPVKAEGGQGGFDELSDHSNIGLFKPLRFALMFNQRTRQAHRKIKQLIANGEFGKIVRVNWTVTDWFRSQSYYDSGSWRATWAASCPIWRGVL